MIELKEQTSPKLVPYESIKVIDKKDLAPELGDYLETYVKQYNGMVSTFTWLKEKLSQDQIREWNRTIASLATICRALDAGFDPMTPPQNWSSGQLFQYIAVIPEHVRASIEKAEAIFDRSQILIYDPNEEHFQRPRKTDPIVAGFVDLARQRIHFLIAKWDIAADLKFIELGKGAAAAINRANGEVNRLITHIGRVLPAVTSPDSSNIGGSVWQTPYTGDPAPFITTRWQSGYSDRMSAPLRAAGNVASKWMASMMPYMEHRS